MSAKSRILLHLALAASLLALLLAGCNLPSGPGSEVSAPTLTSQPMPSAAPPQPTIPAPTQTSAPTSAPTAAPSATATLAQPKALVSGVMVYDLNTKVVKAFWLDGSPTGFQTTIPSLEWLGRAQSQAFENTLYYFTSGGEQVMRRDNQGLKVLDFIPKSFSTRFLVSADQKRIVWGRDEWDNNGPSSQLWLADISGANAKKLLSKDSQNNPDYTIYQPLRWLPDGKLVVVAEPTGIGGYILFYGFSEIFILDPASGAITSVSPPQGKGGLCLKELSPDTRSVISTCGALPNQLVIYNLDTQASTAVDMVTDQGSAGSVFYSPDGSLIAYATARTNPESEYGRLVVVPASGAPVQVIDEVNGGYFNVLGWVDEQRLLYMRHAGDQGTVFIINSDGSGLRKVANGLAAGLIPAD